MTAIDDVLSQPRSDLEQLGEEMFSIMAIITGKLKRHYGAVGDRDFRSALTASSQTSATRLRVTNMTPQPTFGAPMAMSSLWHSPFEERKDFLQGRP